MIAKFRKLTFAISLLLIIALYGACGRGSDSEYRQENVHDETVYVREIEVADADFQAEYADETPGPLVMGGPVEVRSGIIAAGEVSFMLREDGSLWALGDSLWHVMDDVVYITPAFAIDASGRLWDIAGNAAPGNAPLFVMDNVASVADGLFGHDYTVLPIDGRLQPPLWHEYQFSLDDVIYIAGGAWQRLAIRSDNSLWIWGEYHVMASWGNIQLISGEPTRFMENASSAAGGRMHSLALLTDGIVWEWGHVLRGQPADVVQALRREPDDLSLLLYREPARVLEGVALIYASENSSFAIREDGFLFAWGHNNSGQLGDGTQENRVEPVPILDNVVSVSSKSPGGGRQQISTTLAVRTDGSIWVWGSDIGKWTGDPALQSSLVPVQSAFNIVGDAAQPIVGAEALVVTEEMMAKVPLPIAASDRVLEIDDFNARTIAAGTIGRSFALFDDGAMIFLGRPDFEPQLVELGELVYAEGLGIFPIAVGPFISIASGTTHGLAIDEDNRLWNWQEARHDVNHRMDNVARVFAGVFSRSYAIDTEGRLWRLVLASEPIPIMEDVVHFSPGTTFNFALRSDGTLWGWGSNSGRRYSPNLPTSHYTPVFIMDDVAYAAAGNSDNFFVVLSDGRLLAWGENNNGQLGDGTTMARFSPVHIMDNIVSVTAGFNNTFAIDTSGRLWGWGANYAEVSSVNRGFVGDGTSQNHHLPVQIMDNVVSISMGGPSAGSEHTIALRADGSLWAWGFFGGEQITEPRHIMDGVLLPKIQ